VSGLGGSGIVHYMDNTSTSWSILRPGSTRLLRVCQNSRSARAWQRLGAGRRRGVVVEGRGTGGRAVQAGQRWKEKCEARLYAGFCAPGSPPAWPPLLWAAGHPDGSMPPTRQLSGTTSILAYLVLLRAEIARFTRT